MVRDPFEQYESKGRQELGVVRKLKWAELLCNYLDSKESREDMELLKHIKERGLNLDVDLHRLNQMYDISKKSGFNPNIYVVHDSKKAFAKCHSITAYHEELFEIEKFVDGIVMKYRQKLSEFVGSVAEIKAI